MANKSWILLLFVSLSFFACDDDTPDVPDDNFDRTALLTNWADNIIIPGYTDIAQGSKSMVQAAEAFQADPQPQTLNDLRDAWWKVYLVWQRVSMFEIGKAEELGLRDNLNIYPVDTEGVLENISQGNYNLELPSQRDRQGFPAMDFLLYGIANGDAEILEAYTTGDNAEELGIYLIAVVTRIDELLDVVLADWTSGYRDEFIDNNGNSATASVDKLVNDYLFYYEKALRAGKVGIPAGVFSGSPLSTHVELPYRAEGDQTLLLEALDYTQRFFNGKDYTSQQEGVSLKSYLNELDAQKDGTLLSELINAQFESARAKISQLESDFAKQIEMDNTKMLEAYDELQKNVVLLKVDMLQALNINIDYVDADGD